MKVLGIETSCDETAASVLEISADKKNIQQLSSVTATSLTLHAKTGGIIPEVAARNQIKDILPVIYAALEQANCSTGPRPLIDAIAVTYGPGLIGSLLIGVETAKTLSYTWGIPLIPINHLFGHLYVNFINVNSKNQIPSTDVIKFPVIGLIVSGGHTDLVLMKNISDVTWLGGTRDDAAGEAFDKTGRMLGIEYPAGPTIERLAKNGNPKAFHFPRPLMYDKALDFSFSGLKTAVLREVQKIENKSRGDASKTLTRAQGKLTEGVVGLAGSRTPALISDLCHGVQDAIIDVLTYKTIQAAKKYHAKSIVIGGGVAANETLRQTFIEKLKDQSISFFAPPKNLCTDNGVMIAAAAIFLGKEISWREITADPELYFE